jgi:hypothetical protein
MGFFYTILGLIAGFLVAVVFPWMLLKNLGREEDAKDAMDKEK